MPMLLPQVISSFENGDFELDCTDIRIEQEGIESPMRYSGAGFLRQQNRQLSFKLYCAHKEGESEFACPLSPEGDVGAGTILPPHHYYKLTAVDQHGRPWISKRIIIDRDIGPGTVISGNLKSITHMTTVPGSNGIWLRVRGDIKIPVNETTLSRHFIGNEEIGWSTRQNVARFAWNNCSFTLERDETWLTIRVQSDEPFIKGFETRIVETLQFVLGCRVWWSVMQKVMNGEQATCLRSDWGDSRNKIHAPLDLTHNWLSPSPWTMAKKYLSHVASWSGEKFHPISAWLNMARDANGGSAFAYGLALGVAIEGVLKTEFPNKLTPAGTNIAVAVDDARKFIAAWEGDENVKSRIDGFIQSMLKPRAKDKLHSLKDAGVITASQIKAWGKLRNSAAHGTPPEDDELQEWIDLCHAGLVMLYHLIFAVIGYAGEYTDYSQPGWPTTSYKVPVMP